MQTIKQRPVQSLKQRPQLIAIAVLVAAVLGILIWWSLTRQVVAREATHLDANGTIETDEVEIGAQRPARLKRYLVAEGQSVKAGQVIAELDTSELNAQLEQAQGAEAAAEARLKELVKGTRSEEVRRATAQVMQARANVDGAQKTLANAQKGYARRTQLRQALDGAVSQRDVARAAVRQAEAAVAGAKSGLGTAGKEFGTLVQLKQARDAARLQLNSARAIQRSARAQLQQLRKGPRSEQVRAAEAQVKQTTAALDAAATERETATTEWERAQKLHAGNALSDQGLEAAKLRHRASQAQYAQAEQAKAQAEERLTELRNGARPEEIEASLAAVQQADAAVEGGEQALENMQQAYDLRLGARGSLDAARTELLVANAQVASARAQLSGAEQAVRTAQTAYNDALQEKQSADAAVQQYQAALAQLEVAEAQLEQFKNGATQEQIEQARAQLRQAQGALRLSQVQKEQSIIRAPRDGVITEHVARVGEIVNPGATVAKLVPLDEAYLTVYVPLTELGKVKIGQRVDVTTETYGDKKVYSGQVSEISDTPEFTPRNVQTKDEREKLVYQVKVTVDNSSRELKPGMPASAKIQLR
jgi:HlyD family secretion protein